MSDGIFLLQGDGSLVEMAESQYDSEARLQELLARYPHLLPGGQMNSVEPRRWLLVCREAGLPSDQGEGNRWAVDHLFLDQEGVPTLVEVKRSTNSQIRREVVGQLLDYAANAVAFWPVEVIRAKLEVRCGDEGLDAEELILQHTGGIQTTDEFWSQVKDHLQVGKIRLVFVADVIPRELQRIVEFLNGQMDPAEVLAVEVRQFTGEGLQTFVPRLIGQTARAEQKKQSGIASARGETWTWERFAADAGARNPAAVAPARAILDWATVQGLRIAWGRGGRSGSFAPTLDHGGDWFAPAVVYSYGTVEVQFQYFGAKPPMNDLSLRQEFASRLEKIPGLQIPADGLSRRPSFALDRLGSPESQKALFEAFDWFLAAVKGRQPTGKQSPASKA